MTTLPDDPEPRSGLDAVTELYRNGLERPDPAELDRGLAGVRTRIAARRAQRRRVHWYLAGAGATLALLIAVHATSVLRRTSPIVQPPALAYQIEGGSILKGGYLRESGHSGVKLRFNEGSTITFDPGARGRIRTVDRDGAQVAVDHGKALFQVHKSEGRRWLVEVGPFLVTVKGTIFTVTWDPASEKFELRLRQGHVTVSGPGATGDINLEAGQRLSVNLARAETVISEATPEKGDGESDGTPAPEAVRPADAQARPALRPRPAAPSWANSSGVPRGESKESRSAGRWADSFAQGRWERIIDEAESNGVETTLDRVSLDDLFVLADAARYRHRPDLARAALLAGRRRFPDAPRTLAATFLLGRVEESREGGGAQAIAWYAEYLSHAPTGTLAAEALGRQMMLTAEIDSPARARPLADDYLRRFPRGSYARAAHLLQGQPVSGAR